MIGEMSSKMAHDLRNPLTVLQAHVELMQLKQEKQQDENLTYSLTKMEEAITTITNQINDVMSFIRKPKFQFSCCNLKSVLEIITNGMHVPTTVKLDLLLDSHLVKCDVIKIKGVITNIIQNSIQAINARGQIIITLKEVNNNVEIAISDSGDGIPEENLEKIFDPMFTTKPMGTGLGLASCKELIEMHKGTINVKNNPTTFTISLPIYKPE
jgi:signal transduction histidine kinase